MGPQDMNTATERKTEQGAENEERDHLLADGDNNCTVGPNVDIEEFDDGTDQRFYCLITGANRYNLSQTKPLPSFFLSFIPFHLFNRGSLPPPTQRPWPCSLFSIPGALPPYSSSYAPSHFNLHHAKLIKVTPDDRQHSRLPPPALPPRPNRAVYSRTGLCGSDRSTLRLRTDC